MSLITDFVEYCSCYEIPKNFATWTGIGLLGACVNRRIFIRRGDIIHHGNVYLCLVAEQGGKKSTTNDWAREWFTDIYPDIPIACSVQSREDIIQTMSDDELSEITYIEKEIVSNQIVETEIRYHPFMMFINEFEQFLSFNTAGMLSFLTDIYDRNTSYSSGTLKRGGETIIRPSVNLIACCTPGWLTSQIRGNIFTGGICRRMVFVYEEDAKREDGELVCIAIPKVSPAARVAKERIFAHMRRLKSVSGEFSWDEVGQAYFHIWYEQNKKTLRHEQDPFLRGFRRSLDVQLLKVAMLLDMAEETPTFKITRPLLQSALAHLQAVMPNMSKLSVAAGQNPYITGQQALLEYVESKGGKVSEKELRRQDANLNPNAMEQVIHHLVKSGRLFPMSEPIPNSPNKRAIFLNEKYYFEHLDQIQAVKVPKNGTETLS